MDQKLANDNPFFAKKIYFHADLCIGQIFGSKIFQSSKDKNIRNVIKSLVQTSKRVSFKFSSSQESMRLRYDWAESVAEYFFVQKKINVSIELIIVTCEPQT